MTPEDRSALHAVCFGSSAEAWSTAAFARLPDEPACFVVDHPDGFAVGRVALDQSELLTLAVAPEARRRGVGRALVAAFEAEASARGAATAFLEVAADNVPALGLYAGFGYREAGRRRGYYRRADGSSADAIVLRKGLIVDRVNRNARGINPLTAFRR